jgi:uncharacterized protein YjbI with pentapeptide repeats
MLSATNPIGISTILYTVAQFAGRCDCVDNDRVDKNSIIGAFPMTTTTPKTRWQEIKAIWQKEQWLYGFVGTLAGFIVGVAASGALGRIVVWFANGFWNEALSIAITVIVLDRLNRIRANEERKLALFRQAKSRSNDVALEAVDQIRHEGWWDAMCDHYRNDEGRIHLFSVQWAGGIQLQEVNLENANLGYAHLENANLYAAHLDNANLEEAHLENAYLRSAHLENASLGDAHLENASLGYAHLENASLWDAHLENANLGYAHLENADLDSAHLENANSGYAHLENANLGGASLRGVQRIERAFFNEKTVLPGAKRLGFDDNRNPRFDKYWTPDTDMTRYTNPDHPDFWEPEWVKKEREQQNKSG